MPTIASFIEAAKAALLAGDAAQAATVCRHVLGHFPKHIEANCLLAESLRDLGETGAARELFLRVVSADPASLVAHWALGLIAESEGDLEWAAWELARAWDSNPGYAELRGEILRVTGRHPELTALALGQQYADAGLFDKAIAELRAALTAEPTRLDIALALATVLWRAGQRDAAAEVCAETLADSPDCLMANVLLGLHLSALSGATGVAASRANGASGTNGQVSTSGRLKNGHDVVSVAVAKGRGLLERAAQLDPGGAKTAELLGADLVPPELKVADDLPALAGAADEPTEETPWIEEADEKPTTVQAALESRLATAAASRPDADLQALQSLDPSWQELLTEEIVLDADAEARLNQALREMGLPTGDKLDEGWLEVSTAADGSTSSLSDQLGQIAPTAPEAASRPLADESGTPPQSVARTGAAPTPDHAAASWRAGDVDAALAEYRLLLADRPDVADLVVDGLHQLLAAHPDCQEAHRILGDAYMRAGRFQQAIDEYNWVLAKS